MASSDSPKARDTPRKPTLSPAKTAVPHSWRKPARTCREIQLYICSWSSPYLLSRTAGFITPLVPPSACASLSVPPITTCGFSSCHTKRYAFSASGTGILSSVKTSAAFTFTELAFATASAKLPPLEASVAAFHCSVI